MHTAVFYTAVVWMAALLAASAGLVVQAPSVLSRILALDMLVLVLVALLVLFADENRLAHFLDAALALSVLSFVATVAAARYHSEGRLFS
jgi:multicomponent Na+:H+ antiporter subunit F